MVADVFATMNVFPIPSIEVGWLSKKEYNLTSSA